MTHAQPRARHVMVVSSPESRAQDATPGLTWVQGAFDDFALLAARLSDAEVTAVLLCDGEKMQVVGSHSLNPEPAGGRDVLHGLPPGAESFYTLASIQLVDLEGRPIGLLALFTSAQRLLSSSQYDLLLALSRQITAFYELQRQSVTDALTGLVNRRTFESRLAEELERSRRYGTWLSLLLLDVDDFKGYNDAFGHPAGDEVLKHLAARLVESVRASDLVARYGGEEFAVIVPESDLHSALFLAERCRYTIGIAPWAHRGITVSVGVASVPSGVKGRDELLGAADRALYQAKGRGRNRTARAPAFWFKEPE